MSSPSRLLTALIALLAVTAIVLAAAVHQHNTPKARFGRFCRALQSPPGRGAVTPITVGTPTVVVLGDSYASGFALAEPRLAWPTQLGRLKRWEVFVDGVAGTGLTNGGFCAQPYASRVGQVLLHHPQRVLVEVGLNDTGASGAALQRAADALLGRLSAVAQVDVVGPPPVPAKLLADLQRVDGTLRAATQRARRHYISTLAWSLPYLPDGVHLTVAGHRAFAAQVAAAGA